MLMHCTVPVMNTFATLPPVNRMRDLKTVRLPDFWQEAQCAPTADAMLTLGAKMARDLPLNCTLGLRGNLGAGKTTFAKGFAHGIGIRTTVKSPTFQYMIVYHAPDRTFIHLDAYRMKGAEDYESLYIEDLLGSHWTLLVEWPDNIAGLLPGPSVQLSLSCEPDESRSLSLS